MYINTIRFSLPDNIMRPTDDQEPLSPCLILHHPGIVVPDLEAAANFYSTLTGFEIVRETSWTTDHVIFNKVVGLKGSAARLCLLRGKNSYLELFEYSAPASNAVPGEREASDYGIRHLCFEVVSVATVLKQVVALGGSQINDPVTNESGTTAVYCRDPFGNLLELVAPSPAGPFPSLRPTDDEQS